jgi:hypothetical protein
MNKFKIFSISVVGLSALAQLVKGSVAGADWPVLQQLGPAFFRTLASLASCPGDVAVVVSR